MKNFWGILKIHAGSNDKLWIHSICPASSVICNSNTWSWYGMTQTHTSPYSCESSTLQILFFSSPNTISTFTDSTLTWQPGEEVSKGKGCLLTWYVTDPVLQTSVGNRDWREWQGWSLMRVASWDLFLRSLVGGRSICLRLDSQLHTYSAPDILQDARRRKNSWKMTRSFWSLTTKPKLFNRWRIE